VLLRLAYLGVTNALALLRLLPMSDRDKDTEILALRHQITVLQRQLHGEKVRFTRADRAWLAALLHRLPRDVLRNLRLLVRPETVLRWHGDLIARRHARISRPRHAGRPRTVRSIRRLVLRLASIIRGVDVLARPAWFHRCGSMLMVGGCGGGLAVAPGERGLLGSSGRWVGADRGQPGAGMAAIRVNAAAI
jgi:hypothetical protein